MQTMDFKTEMAERTAQIEQIIKKYLPKEEGYQKTIMEAMNYSVLAGGKRLRPKGRWPNVRRALSPPPRMPPLPRSFCA